MKIISIPVSQIVPDPSQPRKHFGEQALAELGTSLSKRQLMPILVFQVENRFVLADGERRWRAAQLVGLKELKAIVFDEKPSEAELLEIQVTINCQRLDLRPLERLDAYKKLMALRGWNATELAKALSVSKATVSKILTLDNLSTDDRQKVQSGELGLADGYARARDNSTSDPSRNPAAKSTAVPPAISRVVCRLADFTVTISGATSLQVADLVAVCERLSRECRKAIKSGLDVSTLVRVLKDQSTQERRAAK